MSDDRVATHYSNGRLLAEIESGLAAMGTTLDAASLDDLAPVDEFHVGGRGATRELCEQLSFGPESRVLDIGCGIGGTARFLVDAFGCHVTGIDLTPEYIDVARTISAAHGQLEQLAFESGNALDMAFESASFDQATQMHVGMNIDDKAALFAEVHRVLKPGARYGIYDILRLNDKDHGFPVPWAGQRSMSFAASSAVYEAALEPAGFKIVAHRDRGEFAQRLFAAGKQAAAGASGPPPIGLHLIMGAEAPTKIANMIAAIDAGVLAPTEIVCERR